MHYFFIRPIHPVVGGQACVFYGAAEFSRDTDLAIVAAERSRDRQYWLPLRAELEKLRHGK